MKKRKLKVTDLKARGRLIDRLPVAIIDIGSNSVRLVVFEGASRNPISLFNEKCLCGLGAELASTGQLGEASVERALMALRRFRTIVDQIGAQDLKVIATAAAREAGNGPDFIQAAENICKVKVEVISGQREAELAAAGVLAGDHTADGLAGDLGGGSLELINIKDLQLCEGVTMPLGGLRLIDQSGGDLGKALVIVDQHMKQVSWLKQGKGRPFHLVGGTWRALIKLHMTAQNYPLKVLHGYKVDSAAMQDFADYIIQHKDPTNINGIEEISKARRGVVPFGALVLSRLIEYVAPSQIVVSNFGVREGLLYKLLPAKELQKDPLIAACWDIAMLRARAPRHALELCEWTDQIYGDETQERRRLRHAACLVSDVGWRIHPSFRGNQTMGAIAHHNYAGVDHRGRVFMALVSYFRHQGVGALGFEDFFAGLCDDQLVHRARVLAAAIRTAHMISVGVTNIIPHTPIYSEGDKIVLELPHPFDALDGERLTRRFDKLAKLLELTPDLRVSQDSRFFSSYNNSSSSQPL